MLDICHATPNLQLSVYAVDPFQVVESAFY